MRVFAALAACASAALCLTSCAAAFSQGAGSAACTHLSPRHIPAQPRSPKTQHITIRTSRSSYSPGDEVPVTVSSSRDFMGFLLQARRVANHQTAGTFVSLPPGTKRMTCFEEADSVTHTDKSLKRNLSFVWKAPARPVGDIRFLLSVVQSYFVYWAGIESSLLSQRPRRGALQTAAGGRAPGCTPLDRSPDTVKGLPQLLVRRPLFRSSIWATYPELQKKTTWMLFLPESGRCSFPGVQKRCCNYLHTWPLQVAMASNPAVVATSPSNHPWMPEGWRAWWPPGDSPQRAWPPALALTPGIDHLSASGKRTHNLYLVASEFYQIHSSDKEVLGSRSLFNPSGLPFRTQDQPSFDSLETCSPSDRDEQDKTEASNGTTVRPPPFTIHLSGPQLLWSSEALTENGAGADISTPASHTSAASKLSGQAEAAKSSASFLPQSKYKDPRAREGNEAGRVGHPRKSHPRPEVGQEGASAPSGFQLRTPQLGILLCLSAILGMVLAASLCYLSTQYCHRQTEVSFSETAGDPVAGREKMCPTGR